MTHQWAIIGCGAISDTRMAPAIRQAKNCQLIAVMDSVGERAKAFATKHRVRKYYDNLDRLLEDKEIEIVYVATPTRFHSDLTIQAARHGKHILCEKPMAASLKECEEMIKVCEKNNVKLMVGFMMRFHSCHRQTKKIMESGELGKITLQRSQFVFWLPPDNSAWRHKPSYSGAGVLIEAGTHCLDLMRFFGGEIKEVSTFVDNVVFGSAVEDTAVVIMRFRSGANGILDLSYGSPYSENRFEIYGSKGAILGRKTIGQEPTGEIEIYLNGQLQKYSPKPINMYVAEAEHLARCIDNDQKPITSGEDGLINTKVLMAAYQSSRKGKTINIG